MHPAPHSVRCDDLGPLSLAAKYVDNIALVEKVNDSGLFVFVSPELAQVVAVVANDRVPPVSGIHLTGAPLRGAAEQ